MPFVTRSATSESPITEGYVAFLPQRWKPNQATRGVVLCHGRGVTYTAYLPTANRDIGYAGLAIDCGGTTNWGNAASQTALTNAFTFLTNASPIGAKTDKVVLNGGSMGCLAALRWVKDNPTKVAALILSIPAVSLVDLHDNNRGGYAAEIETAQGVSGTYAGNATITGRDPNQNTASYTGFPIRIYYSTDDPICVPAVVTAFGAAVGADMQSMGAIGHATGAPNTQAAVDDWLAAHV